MWVTNAYLVHIHTLKSSLNAPNKKLQEKHPESAEQRDLDV